MSRCRRCIKVVFCERSLCNEKHEGMNGIERIERIKNIKSQTKKWILKVGNFSLNKFNSKQTFIKKEIISIFRNAVWPDFGTTLNSLAKY